jgi:hypothetical protein
MGKPAAARQKNRALRLPGNLDATLLQLLGGLDVVVGNAREARGHGIVLAHVERGHVLRSGEQVRQAGRGNGVEGVLAKASLRNGLAVNVVNSVTRDAAHVRPGRQEVQAAAASVLPHGSQLRPNVATQHGVRLLEDDAATRLVGVLHKEPNAQEGVVGVKVARVRVYCQDGSILPALGTGTAHARIKAGHNRDACRSEGDGGVKRAGQVIRNERERRHCSSPSLGLGWQPA